MSVNLKKKRVIDYLNKIGFRERKRERERFVCVCKRERDVCEFVCLREQERTPSHCLFMASFPYFGHFSN